MMRQRESFKNILQQLYPNSNYYLYSENSSIKNSLINFSQNVKINLSIKNIHLIVFVHGLEGINYFMKILYFRNC